LGSLNTFPVKDQLDFSDQYNTPIPPEKMQAFNQWRAAQQAKTGKDPIHDRYDYDVNGFFLSGGGTDERGHATDQFKKPNHPTFSNESIYHGKDGNIGGAWSTQGGKNFYTPSSTNLRFRNQSQLQNYFDTSEPDVNLMPSYPSPQMPSKLR
jgi:hypothetical protein